MSFVAINATEEDQVNGIFDTTVISYSEQREEFEEVIRLCDKDLPAAWSRMSGLLEGELFAEGPTFRYQPSVRELQKSVLLLAIDLAMHVDEEDSVVDSLVMETVEWFPEESLFWKHLAEIGATSACGYKEVLVRRLALKKLCELLPLDRTIKTNLDQVNFILGRPEKPLVIQKRVLTLPMQSPTITPFQLHIDSKTTTFLDFLESFCDLAEEIFMVNPSPRKKNSNFECQHELKLSAPLEITITKIVETNLEETGGGEETRSKAEELFYTTTQDEGAIQLSQAESIKNLAEYSQTSTIRSTRRAAIGKAKCALSNPNDSQVTRITISMATEKFYQILSKFCCNDNKHELDSLLESALEKRKGWMQNELTRYHYPLVVTGAGELLAVELVDRTCGCLFDYFIDLAQVLEQNIEQLSEIKQVGRFFNLLLTQINSLADRLSVNSLLLLVESVMDDPPETIKNHLLPRLELRVRSMTPISNESLVRLLWIKYRLELTDPTIPLDNIKKYLINDHHEKIKIVGTFDGEKMIYITKKGIEAELAKVKHLEKIKAIKESFDRQESKVFLDKNEAISIYESLYFDEIGTWGLILADSFDIELEADRQNEIFLNGILSALYLKDVNLLANYLDRIPNILLLLARQESTRDLFNQLFDLCHALPILPQAILKGISSSSSSLSSSSSSSLSSPDTLQIKEQKLALNDALTLLIRDFTDRDLLKESTLPVTMAKGDPALIGAPLLYCSCIMTLGCPYFNIVNVNIPDDHGIIKELNGLYLSKHIKNVQVAQRLFDLCQTSIAFDAIDPAIAVLFLTQLLDITLDEISKKSAFKVALGVARAALDRLVLGLAKGAPLDKLIDNDIKKMSLTENILTNKDAQRISEMYQLKCEMAIKVLGNAGGNHHNGNNKKAKKSNIPRDSVDNLLQLFVIVPDRAYILKSLFRFYDAELRQWMTYDANTLFESAETIRQLVIHLHNSIFLLYKYSKGDALASGELERIVQFYRSVIGGGVLSYFSPGKLNLYFVAEMIENCNTKLKEWQSLRMLIEVGQKRVNSLDALEMYVEEESSNQEAAYSLICNCLEDSNVNNERLYNICSKLLDTNVSAEEEPLRFIMKQVGRFDKKRAFHRHMVLLAQSSTNQTLDSLISVWGKIVPVLSKPKSTHLVNVWQNDHDFPGDFYYQCEQVILASIKAIADYPGSIVERARLIGLLIGKIAGASNLFVQRRTLVKDQMKILSALIDSYTDDSLNQSMADFQADTLIKDELEAILNTTEAIISTNGIIMTLVPSDSP